MAATGIRTYRSRRGRLPARRRDALRRLLPVYGVPVAGAALDLAGLFGHPRGPDRRPAGVVLEIGSGMGEHIAELAATDPEHAYLAVEAHAPGVANLLLLVEAGGLTNLRVAHGDALALVRDRLPPASLDAIQVLFPDPWPKTRHHKRRLFQPGPVALLRSRLVPGGLLHTATDVADYAQAIRATLAADPELVDAYPGWAPRPPHRPRTRYEQRAIAAGRTVFELRFRRHPPR